MILRSWQFWYILVWRADKSYPVCEKVIQFFPTARMDLLIFLLNPPFKLTPFDPACRLVSLQYLQHERPCFIRFQSYVYGLLHFVCWNITYKELIDTLVNCWYIFKCKHSSKHIANSIWHHCDSLTLHFVIYVYFLGTEKISTGTCTAKVETKRGTKAKAPFTRANFMWQILFFT
jgi:hypothetical protein